MISHLENYAKKTKIRKTVFLFKYDPRNKNSFHVYVDGISSLCMVVRTKNAVIAGYYPYCYKDKEVMNKGGLLVSVTNDQSYTLNEEKTRNKDASNFRGMTYDTYYAIYGNAEMRVKTGERKVFSNFGINNAFFNGRGHKVDKFLCEGDKREV